MSKVQRPTSDGGSTNFGPWTLGPGLRINDLRKAFVDPAGNRIEVLRGVSFSARPGESIAIMGPSGAGKSTLLHLLAGLEAPDHGSIALGEFEVDRSQSTALANFRSQQVGLVFQFHYLLTDLSAAENVALPLLIGRTSWAAAMQQAVALLTEMGLGTRSAHPISHLSGGEQQRVAACRALIKQPALVLADEPTGNLDAPAAARLGELLISYSRRRSAIVIIATHNDRLAQLCNQILRIDEGRVQALSQFEPSLK